MRGLIPFPAEEKLPLRYLGISNLIQSRLEKPVSDSVTRTIEHDAYLDDLKTYPVVAGELRPDATPQTSKSLGAAIWGLIHAVTP